MQRSLSPYRWQLLLVCLLCALPLTAAEQSDPPATPGGPSDTNAPPDSTIAPEIDESEVNEIVVVVGKQSTASRMFVERPGEPPDEDQEDEEDQADPQRELEELFCGEVNFQNANFQSVLGHMSGYCEPPPGGFRIIYSKCSMLLKTDEGSLRYVIPSDGGPAQMQLVQEVEVRQVRDEDSDCEDLTWREWQAQEHNDRARCTDPRFDLSDMPCEENPHNAACYHRLPLVSVLDLERYTNSESVPKAKRTEVDVKRLGGGGLVLGARTERWELKLKAKNDMFELMMGSSSGRNMPGMMGKVAYITKGTASLAPDAPGVHIIQDFYDNLGARVARGGETVSLFGGLIKAQAALIKHGVPLRMETKSAVRIMGLPNFMPNLGLKEKRKTNVTGMHWLLSRHDWCHQNEFPPDYGLVNLADFMTGETEATPEAEGSPMRQGMRRWREGLRNPRQE